MSFRYTGPGIERRTFESLSKPIMYLDAKQNELEDKIGLLEGEAAKYKKIALEEPNSKAAKFYNEFMNSVSTTSDSLAKEGIFSNNIRNKVIKLNTIYNSDILPIGQAYDQKMKELERQRVAKLNNQNLRFSKNANEISIDDYMNNTADYKVLDLNRPEQEGMQLGKILSSSNPRTVYKKVLGGQQYEMERTLGYKIDDMLDSGGSFAQIVADYANKIKASYDHELLAKYGNDIDASFKKGVMLGTGQTTQTQLVSNKDYDYMLDIKKQNYASKLRKDEIDYEFNKRNPPPPKTFSLNPGVVPTLGEESTGQSSKNIKGETNAYNNLKQFMSNPKGKFYTTEKAFVDSRLKILDIEKRRLTKGSNYAEEAAIRHKLNTDVNFAKEYKQKLKILEDKRNNIIKNGVLITGDEGINFYKSTYNAKSVDELKNDLYNRSTRGTHSSKVGYELIPDYSAKVINSVVGNIIDTTGKINLINSSNGKIEDVSSKLNKDGVKTKFGFSPKDNIGYYIQIDGVKYKVDDSAVELADKEGRYAGKSARDAYNEIIKNKSKYSPEKQEELYETLNNLSITAINNAAASAGIQAQTAKEFSN